MSLVSKDERSPRDAKETKSDLPKIQEAKSDLPKIQEIKHDPPTPEVQEAKSDLPKIQHDSPAPKVQETKHNPPEVNPPEPQGAQPRTPEAQHQPYEIKHGKLYFMAAPPTRHINTAGNVYSLFRTFLKGQNSKVFPAGMRLILEHEDVDLRPDMMVVCDRNIIKDNGVHGAPDLIIEVLSPNTAKNDKGPKKYLYERIGVREYWIIAPTERSIEVYLLENGRFELNHVYYNEVPGWMTDSMTDDELAEIKREFKTSLDGFGGLTIKVDDVFDDIE